MMTNPWDIDEAFEPMLTDEIAVTSNGNKQTLQAAVFVDSTADLMNQDMVDTEVEHIQVVCKAQDWSIVKLMKIGDNLEVNATGKKYSIDEVKRTQDLGIIISARSI